MPNHPLAEVFGFPVDDLTPDAARYRENRLCPFNNQLSNCTKSSAENPLGVYSVFDAKGGITITCPVRFRQEWRIATDAAAFFFLRVQGGHRLPKFGSMTNAVSLHRPFFKTLPSHETVYTRFEAALLQITRSEAGREKAFMEQLQTRLDKRLSANSDAVPDVDEMEANANE